MNKYNCKIILLIMFCFNFGCKKLSAQEIILLFGDEYKSFVEEIVNNYHEKGIKSFKITSLNMIGNKKFYTNKIYFSLKNDSVLEIKKNRRKVMYSYTIRNKEFFNLEEEMHNKANMISTPSRNNYYIKQFDSAGFQCKNSYFILMSDTILETQQVTQHDSLNRIIFDKHINFSQHCVVAITPNRFEKIYYSGDTTIYEFYKQKDGLWLSDDKLYTVNTNFQIKNENKIEYIKNYYSKSVYPNNVSKNSESYFRTIVRIEYDIDKLIKRIIQAEQGLNLEEKPTIYENNTQILSVKILKK